MTNKTSKKRKRKVDAADPGAPINPHYIYRRHSKTALAIVGLAASQVGEAIKRGELPPTVKVTPSGRACGWLGKQLIELQEKRLADAIELQKKKVAEAEAARAATRSRGRAA